MKKFKFKKFASAALAAVLSVNAVSIASAPVAQYMGLALTAYADSQSGTVNTDRLNVRSGPGTLYSKVTTLSAGTAVTVTGETKGADGYTWYSISYSGGSGYARYDYISISQVYATASADFEQWMTSQGFPESYKNGLRGLHEKYPNWVFKAQQTGLDWNTVISEESKIGRNLVGSSSISSWKSIATGAFDWANNYWPGFDGASWVQASTELIQHYMDPRNFLSEPYIYQFELQSYDSSIQTREGLVNLVSGTFLAGDAIVPIEGSQVEGGTPIEGSTYYAGGSTGTSSGSGSSGSTSSGSDTSAGPGGSSSSSSGSGSVIVPGTSGTGYTSVGPGGTTDSSSGSTGSSGTTVIIAPGTTSVSDASGISELTGSITAYANWQQTDGLWVYIDADGNKLSDGWHWLDGNNDGTAECYYFYSDGRMAASETVDGYTVNADGQWTDENGVVQTKSVGTDTGSGTDSSVSEPQMKKVPYVDIIMKAAETSGVSPYVLAASILQEQGSGTSDLISGTNSEYPGYYNFYNTGAYAHDGMTAVQAGLKYASESGNGGRPWNTIEKAIIGGASAYGASYVNAGQDTFYLKKFNVQGSNMYNHQFMTHVLAAASEGAKVANAYSSNAKNAAIVFKIPVYNNMPDTACELPTGDGNPNNKLSALSVDGYTITPTFDMDTTEYSLIVDGSSSSININAAVIDSNATVQGAGNVALAVGLNDISITVTAQNGTQRTYKLSVTRRDNVSDTSAVADTSSGTTGTVSVTPGTSGTDTSTGSGPGTTGAVIIYSPGTGSGNDSSGTGSSISNITNDSNSSTSSGSGDAVTIGSAPQ